MQVDHAGRDPGGARSAARLVVALTFAVALLFGAPVARAATLTTTVTPATVVWQQPVSVAGTVDPAIEGQEVVVAVDGVTVTTALTDVAGQYTAQFVPTASGTLTATLSADASVGPPLPLSVIPRVATVVVHKMPFGHTRLAVLVAPDTYHGTIVFRVWHHARRVAGGRVTCRGARTVLRFHTPGVGRFRVTMTFEPYEGLAGRGKRAVVRIAGHRIAVGTRDAQVSALLRRLAWLRFRIPGDATTLSAQAGDSVMAFQKAYRLPRTYVFDGDDWAKLDRARRLTPRATKPSPHIEVDKTRQILMVVRDGTVAGVICVSTGATGNTPEGWFHILRKNPAASTWFGPGVLFRSMTFYGNFAIHGYDPVPPYPASHGCVREPNQFADWVYDQSYVGEAVYVYH